ncbi:MAG: DUF6519 domain-containing protein, partial [Cyanobacteriota bacterium]
MTIRTDATRLRITPRDPRPQRAVAPRQGQVLLDADLQQDGQLTLARIDGDMADAIGAPGRFAVPADVSLPAVPANFAVRTGGSGPMNLTIEPGHGFLDGWRLDNMAACTLANQPHPRTGDAPNLPAVVAIKALVRYVDPVEEPALADKALGDAQASGRLLLDWQVFPQALSGPVSCATVLSHSVWQRLTAPSTGTVAVRVEPGGPGTDPCSLLPQGGYNRLENLLYRLEVHGGVAIPPPAGAPALADGPRLGLEGLKLKLSRRNASLLVAITGISGTEISVSPPAPDPRAWFAPGAWAEIVSPDDDLDPRAALANERLFRVARASDDRVILEATVAALTATGASGGGGWFLRLWDALPDGSGLLVLGAPDTSTGLTAEVPLGDGLLLHGGGGATATFRRGDHWTFAARADGSIDWASPLQQPPHGPTLRYAPLALVSGGGGGGAPSVEDCRIPFARLTDRVLHYRGGDGQSAYAGSGGAVTLEGRLCLAVLRGATPVAGAVVEWSLPQGAQPSTIDGVALNTTSGATSTTNARGEITATWTLNGNAPDGPHQVAATLLGDSTGQPVVFTARFDTARTTGYTPGKCAYLPSTRNVQEAIDGLCAAIDTRKPTLELAAIDLLGQRNGLIPLVEEDRILNGEEVPFNAFRNGIAFSLRMNQPLELGITPFDPIVEVELDLPYPTTDPDKQYWWQAARTGNTSPLRAPWAFQRLRLDGEVSTGPGPAGEPALLWQPRPAVTACRDTVPRHR